MPFRRGRYLDGTCFGMNSAVSSMPTSRATAAKPFKALSVKPLSTTFRQPVPAASFFAASATKHSPMSLAKKHVSGEPRYDPHAEGAVVMKRPGKEHGIKWNPKYVIL
jgi:hypothetical protein